MAGSDAWGDDGVQVREAFDSAADVGADGVFEWVSGEMLALEDGGFDGVDEIVDGSGECVLIVEVLDGGLDRTALAVAEDHEEVDAQLGYGVFDAALDGGSGAADVVAGDADDEEFADAEIEEDLGWDAGVGTADDGGDGILAGGERFEVGGGSAGVGDGSGGEALVAFDEEIEDVVGAGVFGGGAVRGVRRWVGMSRPWLRWR